MRNLVQKNLSGKRILWLFVITNAVYSIMLLITIPYVMSFSQGMKLLDMMPTGYNHEYINSLLSALGEGGRGAYLYRQIPVDMIYPFLFGVSSCLVLAYFLDKLNKLNGALFYLCFIPLFSGFFDYGENFGIIAILKTYPNNSVLLSQITNILSILKSSCTVTYFISLIALLLAFGASRLSQNFRLKK
ncbi:MAG: hypothetical protein IPJ82_19520 [Lewinellaceae bacterium]|nr:hypothetical protein [Lewinellaceae bacterium]